MFQTQEDAKSLKRRRSWKSFKVDAAAYACRVCSNCTRDLHFRQDSLPVSLRFFFDAMDRDFIFLHSRANRILTLRWFCNLFTSFMGEDFF